MFYHIKERAYDHKFEVVMYPDPVFKVLESHQVEYPNSKMVKGNVVEFEPTKTEVVTKASYVVPPPVTVAVHPTFKSALKLVRQLKEQDSA